MNVLLFLIALLLPTLTGLAIINLFEGEGNTLGPAEKVILSFGIGVGLLSFYLFFLGILRLSFTPVNLAPFFLATLLLLGAKTEKWRAFGEWHFDRKLWERPPTWQKALSLLFLALILWKLSFILFSLFASPTYFDDAVTNWNYRAKVIFYHRGIDMDPQSEDFLGSGLIHYPMGSSLFRAWIAIVMGQWDDPYINLHSFFITISLVLLIFINLLEYTSPFIATLACYGILSLPILPFHAYAGYADIILGYYFTASFLMLTKWFFTRQRAAFILSPILLAMGIFTKNDGFILFFPAMVLTLSFYLLKISFGWKEKLKMGVAYLVVVSILIGPWVIFKMVYGLGYHPNPGAPVFEFHPEAWKVIGEFLFTAGSFNILWSALLIIYALGYRNSSKSRILLVPSIAAFLIILMPFIFSSTYRFLENGTTFHRSLLQIAPLLIFTACVSLNDILNSLSKECVDEGS